MAARWVRRRRPHRRSERRRADIRTRPARRPRQRGSAATCCRACRTCIRMRSSARWPASPSASPIRTTASGPGARSCTLRRPHRPGRAAARSRRSSTSRCSKAGYTQVCEFHYLHHQPDGTPYADPAAMSLALHRGRARDRHRPDAAADAVHDRRFRRPSAVGAAAALRPRRRRLSAPARTLAHARIARAFASASRCTRCARCRRRRCAACSSPGSRAIARSTSTSPSRSARCRTASRSATRGRSNGCSITRRSTRAGASSTRRT